MTRVATQPLSYWSLQWALAFAAATFSFACSDSARVGEARDAAADSGEPSTGARAAGAGAGPATSSGGREGSPAGSDVDPAEDAGAGGEFAIALSTTACKGRCPIFDLKLNQSGALEFNGRGNTRQQGWGAKTVKQETAAEILAAIEAASYWALADVYVDAADGCTEVEPEQATYTWSVRTDGPTKIVIDYQGCRGVPELDALRKIPALLIEKLELELWLGL